MAGRWEHGGDPVRCWTPTFDKSPWVGKCNINLHNFQPSMIHGLGLRETLNRKSLGFYHQILGYLEHVPIIQFWDFSKYLHDWLHFCRRFKGKSRGFPIFRGQVSREMHPWHPVFIAVQVNCEAVSLLLSAAEEANLKRLVRVTGKAREGLLGRFNNVKQR